MREHDVAWLLDQLAGGKHATPNWTIRSYREPGLAGYLCKRTGSWCVLPVSLPPVAKGLPFSPGHIACTMAHWACVSGAQGIEPFAPVLASMQEIVLSLILHPAAENVYFN